MENIFGKCLRSIKFIVCAVSILVMTSFILIGCADKGVAENETQDLEQSTKTEEETMETNNGSSEDDVTTIEDISTNATDSAEDISSEQEVTAESDVSLQEDFENGKDDSNASGSKTFIERIAEDLILDTNVNNIMLVFENPEEVFYYLEKNSDGSWSTVVEETPDLGKNGITSNKIEGDGATPAGEYEFSVTFGINPDPGAQLEYKQIIETSYWVDDSDSIYYNKWADSAETGIAFTSEHLIEHSPSYLYAANINYNEECVPGEGSAIFLHCKSGKGYTAGCVAISQESMKYLVTKINSTTKIFILEDYSDLINYTDMEKEDFVKISEYLPDIGIDLKYATEDNFTGEIVYDFTEPYLRYGTLLKLAQVQTQALANQVSLKIWDAYRPAYAQFRFWELIPDSTYVANPYTGYSSHTKGNTLDITLTDLEGNDLEMPSEFDDFSGKADRDYSDVSELGKTNSILLETLMENNGFTGYSGEWWHYSDTENYAVCEDLEETG